MSPAEDQKLDEVLVLLRDFSERMVAVEARLSNLEVDQRLIREAYQEQGKQMGLLLERSIPVMEVVVDDSGDPSLNGEPQNP
jgi:hypothetical protein